MIPKPEFVNYDISFLEKSRQWLSDPEIKALTLTPDFTPESQKKWFDSLTDREDYFIKGIKVDGIAVGACGLKNIRDQQAEYWGYIGDKSYWGKGIGNIILEYIFREAASRKIPEIILRVWNQNIRAIRLYEKYGFTKFKEEEEVVFMSKSTEVSAFSIRRYTKEDEEQWNAFVAASRNGTFLFNRSYMDYHSDRFEDYSLMIFDKNQKLVAIIPANKKDKIFYTHQGLTYGGIITQSSATAQDYLQIGDTLHDYLRHEGFTSVIYKKIPYIYGKQPTDEDRYMLFRNHAQLQSCNISTCIDLSETFAYNRSRKNAVSKSQKQGLVFHKDEHWQEFWQILEENLEQKYAAKPVHSLSEMFSLKSKFQENIHLFTASRNGTCLGGIVIYESEQVAHAQYISVNAAGKLSCALDFILDQLIRTTFKHKKYFDLGSSTEQQGHFLNESLIFQKEGYGGRGVCYEIFEYKL